MKLTVMNRTRTKKSDTKQIRREGDIPAILYSSQHSGEMIVIKGVEFATVLRGMKMGRLSTTIFTLMFGNKERRAVIKDIQYHPTTYVVSHIDFEELVDGQHINLKVPVACTGVADCPGIKLGGMLRLIARTIKVECLPKDIPAEFEVHVGDLSIAQSKRLSDITLPKGVRALVPADEVVVVIARK